jgi:hypothetical protein
MTETSSVVGTPNYMSPEQVQGHEIDGRSDQFSLAVIAYEILTGERPFQGEHLSTVVYKIVAEEPPGAQRINTTLTPLIDQVLRRGLSKKPEDRFPNCSNFVGALEMACAESRGWTTLTAGASGVLPTVSVKRPEVPLPARTLPEAHIPELHRRPSIFLPLLMSVLVVLGVAAVIAWQAGLMPQVFAFVQNQPLWQSLAFWQDRSSDEKQTAAQGQTALEQAPLVQTRSAPQNEPKPAPEPTPVPDTAAAPPATGTDLAPAASTPPQSIPQPDAQPVEDKLAKPEKPSPLGPTVKPDQDTAPAPAPVQAKPVRTPAPRESRPVLKSAALRLQDVWVSTNPPGAKAVLDDDPQQSCRTPCMVHTATGLHHLTISQAGYENEYREIRVGDTAQDIPPITLRKPSGTLLLTTKPPGATVRVDGRLIQQVTPAQITLPPGSYSITVERAGRTQTQRVEVGQSLVFLSIPLGQ